MSTYVMSLIRRISRVWDWILAKLGQSRPLAARPQQSHQIRRTETPPTAAPGRALHVRYRRRVTTTVQNLHSSFPTLPKQHSLKRKEAQEIESGLPGHKKFLSPVGFKNYSYFLKIWK